MKWNLLQTPHKAYLYLQILSMLCDSASFLEYSLCGSKAMFDNWTVKQAFSQPFSVKSHWRICDILTLQCIKMLCFPVIWMMKRVGALLYVCDCVILMGCSLRKLSFAFAIPNNMHNRKEYISNILLMFFFLKNEWMNEWMNELINA